jgi:DNA-binding NarL/FixJ family response regulator
MKTAIIADDHQLVRDTIGPLLEERLDVKVVAGAEDGRTAVDLVVELKPDIVLMDVSMPRLNGIEATRQIVSQSPDTKVLGLSMHSDTRFVTRMLQAGASGYFVKDSGVFELLEAVRTVLDGRRYLPPAIASEDIKGVVDENPGKSPLTPREREVLQLIAEGRTTKAIAAELCIAAKTAEAHRGKIMHKLGIHSVAELTKYAIREGLVPFDGDL